MVFNFGLKKVGIGNFGHKLFNKVSSFGHKVSADLSSAGNWVNHQASTINNALEKGKNIVNKIDGAVQGTPLAMLTGVAKQGIGLLQSGTKTAGSVAKGLTSVGSLGADLLSGNFKNIKNDANNAYSSGKDALSGGKEILSSGGQLAGSIGALVV